MTREKMANYFINKGYDPESVYLFFDEDRPEWVRKVIDKDNCRTFEDAIKSIQKHRSQSGTQKGK